MSQHYNTGGYKISISFQESAGSEKGGFTLIEIVVVVSLIALMLVFSFPKLSGFLSVDNKNQVIRWLIAQRTILRTSAVREQAPYLLRVNISDNQMSTMPLAGTVASGDDLFADGNGETASKKIRQKYTCGGDLEIISVVLPDDETILSGTVDIVFFERGYCQQAIIQMKDGDDRFSIHIEPFLPRVVVYEGNIKFGQLWKGLS